MVQPAPLDDEPYVNLPLSGVWSRGPGHVAAWSKPGGSYGAGPVQLSGRLAMTYVDEVKMADVRLSCLSLFGRVPSVADFGQGEKAPG
jgi:hypothetical protein